MAGGREVTPVPAAGGGGVRWMGLVGFAVPSSLSTWGIRLSTASNAALLITLEPACVILLSPILLGERLTTREGVGALLTLFGAVVVVVNGIPGLTAAWAPRW